MVLNRPSKNQFSQTLLIRWGWLTSREAYRNNNKFVRWLSPVQMKLFIYVCFTLLHLYVFCKSVQDLYIYFICLYSIYFILFQCYFVNVFYSSSDHKHGILIPGSDLRQQNQELSLEQLDLRPALDQKETWGDW